MGMNPCGAMENFARYALFVKVRAKTNGVDTTKRCRLSVLSSTNRAHKWRRYHREWLVSSSIYPTRFSFLFPLSFSNAHKYFMRAHTRSCLPLVWFFASKIILPMSPLDLFIKIVFFPLDYYYWIINLYICIIAIETFIHQQHWCNLKFIYFMYFLIHI